MAFLGCSERLFSVKCDCQRNRDRYYRLCQDDAPRSVLSDVAMFMASVEALEKYPFCNRSITAQVQDAFLEAYGSNPSEQAILRVLKMKVLLSMFAKGRNVKESAVR